MILEDQDKKLLLFIRDAILELGAVCDKYGITIDCDIPGAYAEYCIGGLITFCLGRQAHVVTIGRERLITQIDWRQLFPGNIGVTYYQLEVTVGGGFALFACAGGGTSYQKARLDIQV